MIVILDFEKIVTDISPETGLQVSDLESLGERDRSNSPILIAEDSPLLSKLITDCLKRAGYTELIVNSNGQEDGISSVSSGKKAVWMRRYI